MEEVGGGGGGRLRVIVKVSEHCWLVTAYFVTLEKRNTTKEHYLPKELGTTAAAEIS